MAKPMSTFHAVVVHLLKEDHQGPGIVVIHHCDGVTLVHLGDGVGGRAVAFAQPQGIGGDGGGAIDVCPADFIIRTGVIGKLTALMEVQYVVMAQPTQTDMRLALTCCV